jgi:hypothetical protein
MFKFTIGQLVSWKYQPGSQVRVTARTLFENGTATVRKYIVFLDNIRPLEVFEEELTAV